MIGWLYAVLVPREPELRAQLDAFRDATVDGDKAIVPPRVRFSGTEAFPTRDEARERLAAAEILAEERWKAFERAKEAEQMNARQPNVIPYQTRGVRS